MNTFLSAFFVALPWVIATLLPLIGMAALVVGRRSATWWVAAYFVLLLSFPNNNYGLAEASAGANFYSRGGGVLFLPAINVMLLGLTLQAFLARRLGLPLKVKHNLHVPAAIFLLMLVANGLVAFALLKYPVRTLLEPSGLLHLFNLMLCFYVLTASLRDPHDLDRGMDLFLAVVFLRGLWGLARYVALGGDPANYYANFQHVAVKLTFFDINDGLLASVALFIAGWRLSRGLCRSAKSRLFHATLIVVELLIVALSYRRTGWLGLALVLVLLAQVQKPALRLTLYAAYGFVGLPLMIYKAAQRFGRGGSHDSLIVSLAPDLFARGQLTADSGRLLELRAAWLSIQQSPIWGHGVWGAYDGWRFAGLAWHEGNFTWMHSGVLHIALKTGIIGIAAMLITTVCYVAFVRRSFSKLTSSNQGYLLAGLAGVLFSIPNFLAGTPIIEFRTMQLLGLCLCLPYLSVASNPVAPEVSRQGAYVGNLRSAVVV